MSKEIQVNQELLNKLAKARSHAERSEPRAIKAFYEPNNQMVHIIFSNDAIFIFPAHLGQGLAGALDEDLAQVELTPSGEGLHWETLDVDLSIPGLMSGLYGTKAWMQWLAKKGGSSTSTAKVSASRRNGQKGGRPRTKTTTP
ncbi:MAG: DUF2442 domain-containing protein [Nodularia sp. (in: Bacteria)]|nr:MAG: DUF2442 domain-containing protein [Nodularia sp. (in: cyanobacteria)]TVP65617.1 MAG: DUF2442 domain-containing protein [Nodularia sp. (in: cyanobacteria)]